MSLRNVSVKVVGNSPARIGNITYDNTINVKVDSNQDYIVKKVSHGIGSIGNLTDVYSLNPVDGNILVFNAITGKYVSKKVDSSILDITNIDAGTF